MNELAIVLLSMVITFCVVLLIVLAVERRRLKKILDGEVKDGNV